MDLSAWITTGNGIISGAAMAEKKSENDVMRYSAAYPMCAERCRLLRKDTITYCNM